MDSVLRFLRDWQAGDIEHRPGDPPLPFCPCSSSHLYRAYLEWCRRMGEPRPRPENQFAGDIGQQPGWSKDHKNRRKSFNSSETIRQRFVIPSDKALAGSIHAREPAENLTEWLTRGFFAFNEAMGGPE
jgi:putative DNA primase/helicase